MRKLLALLLILSVSLAYSDDTLTVIKSSLKNTLPGLKVDQVSPTSVANIYEVIAGHQVFYIDGSGRYAFLGNMVDLSTKQSLTQAQVERLSVVNWKYLPLKIAIRQVIGKGQQHIAVFTDPDCPFCRHLERDIISKLTNVTIYYFLFPLPMHENAQSDSKRILCAENPDITFRNWMVKGTALPAREECKNSQNLTVMTQLGNKLGIDATPTIVFPNGRFIKGLPPADYLTKFIKEETPDKITPALPSLPSAMESSIAPSKLAPLPVSNAIAESGNISKSNK